MQLDFQNKQRCWESVSFHREMFGVTIFGLVLRLCIVKEMIFIKKKLVNLFRISFYKLLKIINVIILAILTKLRLVFFFKFYKIKLSDKNPRKCICAYKNMLKCMFFNFLSLNSFYLNLKNFFFSSLGF